MKNAKNAMIKGNDELIDSMSYEELLHYGLSDEEYQTALKRINKILNKIPIGWKSPEVKAHAK